MARAMAQEQSLASFLDRLDDERAVIVHENRRLHVSELAEWSRHVAGGLVGAGIEPGDRVGIWLPNIPEWLVLYFACMRAGAIAVPVNTRFRSTEVQDIVGRSGCRALAFWPGFPNIDCAGILAEIDPGALADLETLIVYRAGPDEPPGEPPAGRRVLPFEALSSHPPLTRERGTPDSPCLIFTTSGTTALPKFALHRQAGISGHARAVAHGHGYDAGNACLLQLLPFCGAFGHAQAMANLAAGRPMILQTVFDAAAALRLGRQYRVSHFNASDEMIARLLDADPAPRPLPDLAFCGYARFSGVAGLVEDAARRGVRVRGLYGMSEVQALFALQPTDPPERATLGGGVPVSPDARVRVSDPETGAVLPDGELGEIEIHAPSTMVGYFGDPGATTRAFREDGFLRTGDIGYTTGDGGFVFVTRAGDVLRLGGFLVAPAEIEAFLERHPGVTSCAVVAGAGRAGGKAVAFVTPAPAAQVDEAALIGLCREGLARFKVPARIFVLDSLPTVPSPNGAKIRRNLLRQWAQEWTRGE